MQIHINFARRGGSRPKGYVQVAPRHSTVVNSLRPPGVRPTRFCCFSVYSCVVVLTASFFPKPSGRILPCGSRPLSLVLEPLLRPRSFPYPRFFNSRAWALVLSLVLAFTPHVLSFFAVAFFFRFPLLRRLLSRAAPHCAPKSTRAF